MNFNAYEIFEIARKIEANGSIFYGKAAAIVKDPGAKAFLKRLAQMEDAHESYFSSLQEELSKFMASPDGHQFPFDLDFANQLKTMADAQIFSLDADPAAKLSGKENVVDILRIAVDFEKNSVVFFTAVKAMVPDSLGKEKVETLISEELAHTAMLSGELNRLLAIESMK